MLQAVWDLLLQFNTIHQIPLFLIRILINIPKYLLPDDELKLNSVIF